jgi:sulfite reductase (NADPH) flavoprotein alpha-component
MIGPGTGIAPYRAFLQERLAARDEGRNWIFFGERNRASDYYYETFWTDLEKQGRLRLDLAFSRDGSEKIYVQNKMYEQRKALWQWIEEGAYLYLCGNADKMAKDVDAMLHRIVHEEGHMSEEDSRLYIKKLRIDKRYLADVY